MNCDYCQSLLDNPRPGQRFCVGKNCRQKWHRENGNAMYGRVYGIYQRPNGGWSVVLHFTQLPANIKRGQIVTNMETRDD